MPRKLGLDAIRRRELVLGFGVYAFQALDSTLPFSKKGEQDLPPFGGKHTHVHLGKVQLK